MQTNLYIIDEICYSTLIYFITINMLIDCAMCNDVSDLGVQFQYTNLHKLFNDLYNLII